MIRHFYGLPCAALLLFSCASAQAQPVKVEAEAHLAAGDLNILERPDASGGKAVSMPREWNPLLIAAPPQEGAEFTIWVRYAKKPVLLKSSTKDGQKDLQWLWDSPDDLTWKKAGRWKREEIGENLIVIRGGDGGQGPILDCVVFATDAGYDPNTTTPVAPAAIPQAAQQADKAANIGEGAAVALKIKDTPDGQFFEAEDASSGSIVEAEGASKGNAVRSDNDWQPLVNLPLPPQGDAWKVWVRHKGGPFCIKTTGGDRWFWNSPTNWEWRETDVFSREELRGALTIQRGDGGAKADSPQIDAVVLAPEKKRDLPADKPDPAAKPQKVAASVNWSAPAGPMPAALWGINEDQSITNDGASPGFQTLLGGLHSPLIRLHNAGMAEQWTNAATRDWDVEKIRHALQASTGYGNAKLMVNIPHWPSWISQNDTLDPAQAAEFAKLCGRLVKVFRDDLKRPVAYWEITNELDNSYEKAGKLDQLWALYNECAGAMRREDPKAKLGGPALTWAKGDWVAGFLQNCSDVQFVTWHNYGTGDLYESNEKIFENVGSNVAANAKNALALIEKYAKGRKLETFLTEYNVKYTWDPYERRHQNVVGSLFQASVVKAMADLNLSGATLWQQNGHAYGSLIDGEKTYLSYTLYGWGSKYLSGIRSKTVSGDISVLELLAVTNNIGQKSVLLLNKADHTLILTAASSLLPDGKTQQQLTADGQLSHSKAPAGELSLPGYSLTLITTAPVQAQ